MRSGEPAIAHGGETMGTNRIRIGFVGVGSMGQCAHLRNYAALAECEVVAIAELRSDLAKKVAARYGVPNVYADHRAMLGAERLDGLVAAQPFDRHGLLVPELRAAGLPVFIEKPLAGSVQVGERILNASRKHPGFLAVGYHKRSDPATMCARHHIETLRSSGRLGKLTYVRILMPAGDWIAGGLNDLVQGNDPDAPLDVDPPPADMDDATFARYTSFVNYYIHQLNLLRHLLGEAYGVAYADPTGKVLVFKSDSGLPAVLEMSPYQTTLDWQEQAFVAFERGWLKLDLPAPLSSNRPGCIAIFEDPGDGATPVTTAPQLPWTHAMRQQALHFLAAIRGERAPMCDAAAALEDLRVARHCIGAMGA